jgi:hypothetical protein
MGVDQSENIGNNHWVHSFLSPVHQKNLTTKEEIDGVRSFSTVDCMQVFVGDYILKWSDNGVSKAIYIVTQTERTDTKLRKTTGVMKDLVAAGQIDSEAIKAIEKVDKDIIRKLS